MDYANLCRELSALCRQTATFLRHSRTEFRTQHVEVKGENNFVSWVDKTSEAMLIDRLRKLIPGSAFIAEENTVPAEVAEFTWIIDPLDGTTNYIHGIPLFCISIGLLHHNELVAGIIHEVGLDEVFYAWKGGGAYMNETRIQVTDTKELKDSLLATGFPYYDYSKLDAYMEIFTYCLKSTHGLRRLGSAAADMAYVACGRFDAFFEYGLKSWDVAAGIIIVQEAGGVCFDFQGGTNFLFGQEIVAGNPEVAWQLKEKIEHHFSGRQ